jgi:hypothetical protein
MAIEDAIAAAFEELEAAQQQAAQQAAEQQAQAGAAGAGAWWRGRQPARHSTDSPKG